MPRQHISKSLSVLNIPNHFLEEPIALEDYYLNRHLIAEEKARKSKNEKTKRELADFAQRHEQSKIPNLYFSRREKNILTDKIGCLTSVHKIPSRDIKNKFDYNHNKEEDIIPTPQLARTPISQINQQAIEKLSTLNTVLSNKRSDDLRFNELEYQSILAKEYKQRTYEDYNKYLNNYVDSLIARNKNYLHQVLGFREAEIRKRLNTKLKNSSSNSHSNRSIIALSNIPHKSNGRYDLGKSSLKDNPIIFQDSSLYNKMIRNGKYIVNNN